MRKLEHTSTHLYGCMRVIMADTAMYETAHTVRDAIIPMGTFLDGFFVSSAQNRSKVR